jgi:hypothetical protein
MMWRDGDPLTTDPPITTPRPMNAGSATQGGIEPTGSNGHNVPTTSLPSPVGWPPTEEGSQLHPSALQPRYR